jgi:PKD repeat protein
MWAAIALCSLLLFASEVVLAYSIPDWVRTARVAGLSIQNGASQMEIEQKVIKLKNEGVSVVELDTSLSKYWTEAEFDAELAFIQTVSSEIHARGMKVVVYYPALEVVTENGETSPSSMFKDHPDWVQRGLNGEPNVFYGSQEDWVSPGSESAWMSPSTGYKDYFIARCIKLVTQTDVDGIWVDVPLFLDTGAPWADASPAAKAAFTAWSAARGDNGGQGYNAPSTADFNDPVFRIWLRWRHEHLAEFIDDVRAAIHGQEPNFVVGVETYPMDYLDTVWTGLDPAFMYRPDNFFRIWEVDSVSNANGMKWSSIEDFSSKIAMYKWGRGIDREMPGWAFSYAFEGRDAGLTIAATVATKNSPFESQTPVMTRTADSQTRQRWYEFVRDNDEALLNTDRLARAAIWFSSATREYQDMPAGGIYGMYLEETPPTADADWWAQFAGASFRAAPHLGGTRGAAHALIQLGMAYKVVQTPGAALSQLDGLSFVWLPSVGCISDAEANLLREFVQSGGTVLATGSIVPGTKDELGFERAQSALDDVFGFAGSTSPGRRMNEFGQGVAIYRPDLSGLDLFAGQGGNTGLAERTLGEVEQIVKIHAHEDLIVDLPQGVFIETSEVKNDRQHLYIVNYTGLQQPLVTNVISLPIKYRAPAGYRVTGATIKTPDLQGTTGNLATAEVAEGVYESRLAIDQFALVTYALEPITAPAPADLSVTITDPERLEAVTSGLNFILTEMRHSNAQPPVSYGIRTNLLDNDGPTDVYTGGWHVTNEHMGLFLRVTALLGEQAAFGEAYQFVRDVLYSKGYHVLGWSMHKNDHTRFLQPDEFLGVPGQAAANAPLDDLRAIRGLLDGEYLLPEAAELGRTAGEGLLLTTVTDSKRGIAPKFPNYPGGILGISFDWEDQDNATLTPAAVASGVSRLSVDPIPVDYQDLETMAMLAREDPRWIPVIASAVDLLLDAEIPGAPGFFYNSLDRNGNFSGDFEYVGERQGLNLKVIQELWTILHLKRVSEVEPWILDSGRAAAAAAAAQRGYDAFKTLYLLNGERIPEYLTFQGTDVPDGNTGSSLIRGVENLFNGEARIYAQLARIALLFDDRAFAARVIENKILTDRISDPNDPRYGMIGVSTSGNNDAEAWNTLESLLTILLEAQVSSGGNPNNQPPVAEADSLVAGTDAIRRIYPVELLGNDTDPDGDILSIQSVDSTTGAGGSIVNSQGNYLYTPPAGYLGIDSFSYTVTDGDLRSSAQVTLEVTEGGGGPSGIIVDGDLADWPQTHPSFIDPIDITGAGNILDVIEMHLANDDSKIYVAYETQNPVAFNEGFTLHIDADRNPATGYGMWRIGTDFLVQGPSVFAYAGAGGDDWAWRYIGDGAVGVNGTLTEFGFDRSWIGSPASFDFILYGDNEAYGGSPSAVDYIPDNVDGSNPSEPTYLTYILTGDNASNQPPEAVPDQLVATKDAPRTIARAELLANDSDPNFDSLSVSAIDAVSAQGGTIAASGPNYVYTPPAGFVGTDTFDYTITDGALSASAQVTITVSDGAQPIVIDGALGDWPAAARVIPDPDDVGVAANRLDVLEMRLHNDAGNLYLAYVIQEAVPFNEGFTLYIDMDQSAATGFGMWTIGADYVMQGNTVYRYSGTGADWVWTEVGTARSAAIGTVVEVSVGRDLLGNPAAFDFILYGDNEAYGGSATEVDYIPDNVEGSNATEPTFLTYVLTDSSSNTPPRAGFTPNCTGLECTFADASSDSDGTIASWSWDFGDGDTSSAQSPSHSYAAAGTYNVSLTVTDNAGASGSTSQSITVSTANVGPTAAFSYNCTGLGCSFTDASGDSDGTIASWSWDFGDGNTSSAQSPSHSYAAAGTYNVSLTVTDNAGASSDAAEQQVTVSDGGGSDNGPNLLKGSVQGVGDTWQTVSLPDSYPYTNPVVVASVQYEAGAAPAVARVRNAAGNSFELKVQSPGDGAAVGGYTVRYVVVEAGVYTAAEDGIKLEAGKVASTRTDGQLNGWVGQALDTTNTYSQPVVLGQVMSDNDAAWSVFWARGADRSTPPSGSALFVGKHVGEDPLNTRASETLGYIVLEAGTGSIGGLGYKAGVSAATVFGVDNGPPYPVAYGLPEADGGVVSSAAMTGGNGGWPVLYGAAPFAGGNLDLAIDEDQIKDPERWHSGESVGYLLFSAQSGGGGGDTPKLYGGRVDAVGSAVTTVSLPETYTDAVVVAAVQYDANLDPAVARVSNVGTDSFELRLQNPSGLVLPAAYTVHYLVAEAGVYTELEHGIKLEARKLLSTRTDSKSNGWTGQLTDYVNAYTQPVVLGQVMSENDARWSVFWARGASRSSVPDSANLWVGKHAGEDPDDARANETLGYLVLEAGSGVLDDGNPYQAGLSALDIYGTGNGGAPYAVAHGLASAGGAVLASATMRGGDGGWPVLYGAGALDGGQIGTAIEEDRVGDDESWHTAEQVGFVVFGGDGGGSDPVPDTGPRLSYGSVSGVDNSGKTVVFAETYTAPVVVATVQYGASLPPAVARVSNVGTTGFDVRVQSPGEKNNLAGAAYTVQYVVAEQGVYTEAEHGIKMEVRTLASTRTDGKNADWVGQSVSYTNTYTNPVVLGQVMSENDAGWSVFWARGASRAGVPDAGTLYVGKHVGEDTDTDRAPETLGFIVVEAGAGVADGQAFSAGVSAQIVKGAGSAAAPFAVAHGLGSASGAMASMAGMAGGDGAWPVLYGPAPLGATELGLAADEDQIADTETWHTAEAMGFLVFP